ncbi:MAG: nicotinate phosphoribosyltransferase [Candidatus Omnitrophica bacterium]|nr:nicotinate phosphoribosyltransferase [Candidatus Omnitrophota bacterium]
MSLNLSSALLTDLYQLTMAYAYWKSGTYTKDAVFHLYFRNNPFQGGFTVCAGLQTVIDYLKNYRFSASDITYLASLKGGDNKRFFDKAFLDYLAKLKFSCDIDAVPEGTVVFPNEPLLRVRGPIMQGQLLETPLLNIVNFQTLIATKAARVAIAAKGDTVLEFGLRRAQGFDGAVYASRAAYIGGCAATSNVLAGKMFDIPVKGTHAHSWVMSFDDELESFYAYARAMPNNAVFLVDTYNTMEGIKHAIEAGRWLRDHNRTFAGIRIDSGDLAYFSKQARRMLDRAGFKDAKILASNDLDENIIESLKEQGARISVWGVGTKLATAYDQPALGGVYKLSAVRKEDEEWEDKLKLSEQSIKVSHPGILQVRRYRNKKEFIADAIYDIRHQPDNGCTIIDPYDATRKKIITKKSLFVDLLEPVFAKGRLVCRPPKITQSRQRTLAQLDGFHGGLKRFINPHQYPVGMEAGLFQRKTELVLKARSLT